MDTPYLHRMHHNHGRAATATAATSDNLRALPSATTLLQTLHQAEPRAATTDTKRISKCPATTSQHNKRLRRHQTQHRHPLPPTRTPLPPPTPATPRRQIQNLRRTPGSPRARRRPQTRPTTLSTQRQRETKPTTPSHSPRSLLAHNIPLSRGHFKQEPATV